MKKSLLLLASVLMSAASFAQSLTATWEKPTVTNFVDMADDGETTQYLWNVGAQGFLAGHNDFNTRASVAEFGDAVRMKALEGGTWNLGCYPAQYTDKNKWLYVSANAWDAQWVDAGNAAGNTNYPGTDLWVVTKQANGSYKFTNNAIEGELPWGVAESCKGESPNTRCFFYNQDATYTPEVDGEEMAPEPAFSGAFWDEWKFVTPEEYGNVYLPAVKRYNAAMDLKEKIQYALDNGIAASDLASEIAVYNNTSSTTEELEKAAASAYDKGRWVEIKDVFEDVVPGEKNDVSGVFVNPDMETGDTEGWDITYTPNSEGAKNVGFQDNNTYKGTYVDENGETVDFTISNFIEAWKNNVEPNYLADGSITQTIPGLPAGKYMLAVDVVAYYQWGKSQPDDVELFAKASLDGKEYSIPMATGDGQPEHYEFTFVHTGGSMTLGLRVINSAEAEHPANWIAMDNLKLYYYGATEEDPAKIMLDAAIEKALKAHPLEDLEEVVATASIKNAYKTTIEAAQNATSDYAAEQTKVEEAVAALEEAIEAYKKFQAQLEEWEGTIDEYGDQFDSDEWGDFADFIDGHPVEGYPTPSPEAVLEEMVPTAAELNTYIEQANEMFHIAVGKSLKPGVDVTFLLVNGSFENGFEGWTNKSTGTTPGTFGGLKAYPCVECYDATVDVYQVVKHVPDGVYSLTCQAFERPAGNETNTIDMEGKVSLYMNEWTTPVQNLLADAMPEDKAKDYENCFISGGEPNEPYWSTGGTTNADFKSPYGYVPNGMSGASYAFRADRYQQQAYGMVTGGEMKVGLSSNGERAHWVLWAQFKLVYEGAEAADIMLDKAIEDLNAYVEKNADNMNEAGKTAAEEAAEAAEKVAKSGDNDAIVAEVDKVNAALEAAKANVAAMNEFNTTNDLLTEALEDEDHNPAGEDAYGDIQSDVDGGYQDMTTEELLALVEKMKEVIDILNTPAGYEEASDTNPVDFTQRIVNSDFETGDLTGWTYNRGLDTKAADNSDGTYTVDIAEGYVFNTWSNAAVEGDALYIEQNLGKMPVGTYELKAIIASHKGHTINLWANDEATSFTMEGEKGTGFEASMIFKLEAPATNGAARRAPATADLTIKLSSAKPQEGEEATFAGETFFKADNIQLIYYGTDSALEPTATEIEGIGTVEIANGAIFNIAGQRVNGSYKGLIIKNGKKYLVK